MHYSNVQPHWGRVRGLDGAGDMLTRGKGFHCSVATGGGDSGHCSLKRDMGFVGLRVGRGSQEVMAMDHIGDFMRRSGHCPHPGVHEK